MNEELLSLKPERIWFYFKHILDIPRPSKSEDQIIDYIESFGKNHGLEVHRDETGNLLIRKPATKGMEDRKMVCLQSHVDMVCEKNADKVFDFDSDSIETYIDNSWIKANGTTLGADDGIGIATQLALLESSDVKHGPIECLFTVDEETGLTGAFGLKPDFLQSKILLNLDSEDEGELFIGCAGGADTTAELPYLKEATPSEYCGYLLNVSGLIGGHSGDDINKSRGNANKILVRILWNAAMHFDARISKIEGGKLRNAIAREAYAILCIPTKHMPAFQNEVKQLEEDIRTELKISEPHVKVELSKTDLPSFVLDATTQKNLLNALYACPHGVVALSQDIPNFVETSTNLAAIKTEENRIVIVTSQRSSIESSKINVRDMVASVFRLTGAKITHSDGYPGWKPNPDSEIVKITTDSYRKLFNKEPKVLAVHAGLECGLIGDKYPGIDMISFGPTIKGAHSPDERLDIATVQKFWDLTIDVLENIPRNAS